MKQRPVWKFGSLDLEFPWGFSIQGGKKDFDNVVRKLKDFEKLSWAEIYTNKKWNHPISISKISKQAKRRLEKLNIDANDQGSLYQLRISQKERLFGIRESEVFYVLWWDPNHEVCPSEKRHT